MQCNRHVGRAGPSARARVAAAAVTLVLGTSVIANAAIFQWDGGGSGTNWGTSGNWFSGTPSSNDQTDLEFGSVALQSPFNTTATNNITSDFNLNSITFNGTAGASFSLTGSSLEFKKDGSTQPTITQNSSFAQSIASNFKIGGDQLTFGGNGSGIVTLSGLIDGGGKPLFKTGTSTFLITGNNTNLNSSTTINGGTIIVGHAAALDTDQTITVNSTGTLAINTGVTFTRPVTFNSGSTLAGKGTYTPGGTFTVASGRTVAPGINDIGTLTIGNSTTFAAGSIFAVSVGAGAANNDRLNVTGTLNTGAANTLALDMTGADQGKYTIASATTLTIGSNTVANGGFGSVTGLDSAYRLNADTTADVIELIHKATIAIDAAGGAAQMITGGSISFSGHVANVAPTLSDTLNYTLSGSTGVSGLPGGTLNRTAGDANAAAGALYSGNFTSTTLGVNNVAVTATGTDANVSNSPQSANFNVTVLDHAAGSVNVTGGAANFGSVITGAAVSPVTFNLANAAGTRADLQVNSVASTGSASVLSGGPAFTYYIPAGSNGAPDYSAAIDTSAVGAFSATHTFTSGDDQSLAGANALNPDLLLNITGAVLAHSDAAFDNVAGSYDMFDLTGSGKNLAVNFGVVELGAGGGSLLASFDLLALVVTSGFTAGLDLDDLLTSGDTSELALSGLTGFTNNAAGSAEGYTLTFNTTAVGTFNATYIFKLSDQNLAGASAPSSMTLTLNVSGKVAVVPAPGSLAVLSAAMASLIVRRRRRN